MSGGWMHATSSTLKSIQWRNYIYASERLHLAGEYQPFVKWAGNRGRASKGTVWQEDVLERFGQAAPEQLTALAMRQAFFYGYLKEQLKKPLGDPYDVDGFIVSYAGRVMPVEVKEKSRTAKGDFGIDAGRILMMLRLCLITDSNALYLIREVDSVPGRPLLGWRYITLSDMIIGASWNLQAGGAGMTGGATQTVMMPGSLFQEFTAATLSEEWLAKHSSLQTSVRSTAQTLMKNLNEYL